MKKSSGFLREVAGLFFDDRSLAFAILGVLAAVALLVKVGDFDGPGPLVLLVGGMILVLLENIARTAGPPRSRE